MKATQELMDEHEQVLSILDVLDKLCKTFVTETNENIEDLEKIVDFLSSWKQVCHHKKEEDLLFVALKEAGTITLQDATGLLIINTIAEMIKEHEQSQILIRNMQDALAEYKAGKLSMISQFIDDSKAYIHLQRNHIRKEDQVLYPMAQAHLTSQKLAELAIEFDRLEKEGMGHESHDELYRIVDRLKSIHMEK
ncbi:MAG: hemerythrin domain-containing protein [Candidatus Heimdallarchaeota archaeon]